MSKMDDVAYPECDLYVEDERAGRMLIEILTAHDQELVRRCQVTPYGAASVGQALGQMVAAGRFQRPTCVFLDGDRGTAPGCSVLPGQDAPERVVFEALAARQWQGVDIRMGRAYSQVVDACNAAMVLTNHHDWVLQAATPLVLGGDMLWQALCAEWATNCLDRDEAVGITRMIRDRVEGISEQV